jgi:hypothetical protein
MVQIPGEAYFPIFYQIFTLPDFITPRTITRIITKRIQLIIGLGIEDCPAANCRESSP